MSERAAGHRHAFDLAEATTHFVATITVHIAAKDGAATSAQEGAEVVASRAIGEAANVYAFHNAQVAYVTLVSLDETPAAEGDRG